MRHLYLAIWLALTASCLHAQALQLGNADWQVALEPSTLAISVTPTGQTEQQVSSGLATRAVSALQQNGNQASWQWLPEQTSITARLNGADLEISLSSTRPGVLPLINQPGRASGKALILPLGEGAYIPSEHEGWRSFILQHKADLNSSEDLSLPLWGTDYGDYSLTWLLTNPFNNRLHFRQDQQHLALALSHEFTSLDPSSPMTLILHLSRDKNPLAGAQRYRTWLQQHGQFTPLRNKLEQTPESRKLLGASHIYLWGNDPISTANVRNPRLLLERLRSSSPLTIRLRTGFDAETRQVLSAAPATPDSYQLRVLVRGINQAMAAEARKTWQVATPDWSRLANPYRQLMQQLQHELGSALSAPAAQWGGGLSQATITQLQQAGLSRLWLGVDNWEGGLWHPEAVQNGTRAGYLMAAYDSYETSLAPGQRSDWVSAQLGGMVHQRCGIMRSNGELQAGFQKSGYYTNPVCVRPDMQARVTSLLSATGFNSWFLDVYASGMVFDDYRNGQQLSQRQMADAYSDNMRWIGSQLKLPLGSENGNASTSQGVAFAHGMQVPVIGWGDQDMQKNRASRFFTGRWAPEEQPEIFFAQVPLKPQYVLSTFDPAFRLPLYQAVFHDSVISSNHWLYDNFKFSNVDSDNRLAQMLYNVPPLYHLSSASLQARLPRIRCTDAFFRPLHQQLALQALTGFSWLSDDRLVQQTQFADGSRLTANYSAETRSVNGEVFEPHSVNAWLASGARSVFSTETCH